MYYVIIKQVNNPASNFFGFIVQKYIAAKNTENVIFEVVRAGKIIRKWVDKSEIILVTDDKAYFVQLMHQFRETEAQQQALVDQAQKNLEESLENFTKVIDEEIHAFETIRDNEDVPCLLKDL